jgi:hypothetical protein
MMKITRKLMREERRWRDQTLAFDSRIRPVAKAGAVYLRHCDQLERRNPVLAEAVQRASEEDAQRDLSLTFVEWKAALRRRGQRLRKIYEAGRRRRSRR